ncbi:hypothetical protein JCM10207_002320 [Rhodosporidiobolus poonsookiae]
MDMDNLELPAPPPLRPRAPSYRLPVHSDRFPRFATLEYPGPVHSVDAALGTVGGIDKLADVLEAEKSHNKHVELDLQPGNPFFHPVPAHVTDTRNVVVKITKRRRKRPKTDIFGNVVEEGIYTVEPVGIEHKTVRFRAMADFQYTPKVSQDDPTLNLVDSLRTMDIAGIRNFKMPEPSETFDEAVFLPPPAFSRHALPQVFDMRPATASVRITNEAGVTRLINNSRHKTRAMQTIQNVQRDVPQGPEARYREQFDRANLVELEARLLEVLEERPVWTRTGLLNQLSPEHLKLANNNKGIWPLLGYTFADGPFRDLVVRFGYDPRTDREARFYQNLVLRNLANVRVKALPGTRAAIQSQSASGKKTANASASVHSHEFDGQHVYSKIGNFQLCDISDPLLRTLIESETGVLPVCSSDLNEGWWAYDYLEQMRQVLRRKWTALLQGIQLDDADCQDILEWEISAESRGGRSKPNRAAAAAKKGGADGAGKKGKAKGKGKARSRSGSLSETGDEDESGASGSGSGDGSGSGSGSDGGDGTDGDEGDEGEGSGLDEDGSGSDAAGRSSPGTRAGSSKGGKRMGKTVRAPWEAPKQKKGRAKKPEPEGVLLARLNRSVRNSRASGSGGTPALPVGEDPFEYVEGVLHAALFAPLPHSFTVQLRVLLIVCCVEAPVFVLAYAVRAYKTRQFLPFRLHRTARGTYVSPHAVLHWQLFSIVFLVILAGLAHEIIHHVKGVETPGYMVWMILPWLGVWAGAFGAAWGLAVALFDPLTGSRESRHWLSSPIALNSFLIGIFVLCPAALAVLAWLTQTRYNDVLDALNALKGELAAASANFNPSASSSSILAQLDRLIAPLQLFLDCEHNEAVFFRASWSLWVGMEAIPLIICASVAPPYFLHIGRQIKQLDALQSAQIGSVGSIKQVEGNTKSRRVLKAAFADTLFRTIAIICAATFYLGLTLTLAILGTRGSVRTVPYQVVVLSALYVSTVVAAPTGILAVVRAFQLLPSPTITHASSFTSPGRAPIISTLSTAGGVRRSNSQSRGPSQSGFSPPHFMVEVVRTIEIDRADSMEREKVPGFGDDLYEQIEMGELRKAEKVEAGQAY